MGSVGNNLVSATSENKVSTSENKQYVVKRLVKAGLGLPYAIRVYNQLSADGFYEVEKKELTNWIRRNA